MTPDPAGEKPSAWEQIKGHIISGFSALFSIAYQPAAWQRRISQISPRLRQDFSLLDLSPTDWKQPAIRNLVFQLYALSTFMVLLVLFTTRIVRGASPLQICQSLVFGWASQATASLVFGIVASVPAGAVFGLVFGVGMGLFVPGNIQEIYFPIGFSLGFTGSVLVNLTSTNIKNSFFKTLRAFLTTVSVAGLIYLAGVLAFKGAFDYDAGTPKLGVNVPEMSFRLEMAFGSALILSLIISLTLILRGQKIKWGLFISSLLGLSGGVVYFIYSSLPGQSPAFFLFGGLGGGNMFSALFGIIWAVTLPLAGRWPGATAAALASGLIWFPFHSIIIANFEYSPLKVVHLIIVTIAGLTRNYWRPLIFYPFFLLWNRLLYLYDYHNLPHGRSLFKYHAAFWIEMQYLPWLELDAHLLLLAEHRPVEAQSFMRILASGRQRWATQIVQLELAARRLEKCQTITQISQEHTTRWLGELPGFASDLLNNLAQISQDIFTALKQNSAYHKRLALGLAQERLQMIERDLMLSNAPYAVRFSPIVVQWEKTVKDFLENLAELVVQDKPLQNPYICGTPITPEQHIFVGRADIIARIERLLLEPASPPLLIYGQRRMGKTSLLLNLGRILPSSFIPMFVDCQGLSGVESYAFLLLGLARQMTRTALKQRNLNLPTPDEMMQAAGDPFSSFQLWLDEIERILSERNAKALIMFDEFEALDSILRNRAMQPEPFFSLLRNLTQHRQRFRVLFAGSHTLDEWAHWSAYLVNAQVIKISYLERSEALQLIEKPVPQFPLTYHPCASQSILALTSAHPHLIQQICFELVEYKNEQPPGSQMLVQEDDVEQTVPRALKSGSMFFMDIQNNQIIPQAASLLRTLAALGPNAIIHHTAWKSSCPDQFEEALANLLQRDLVEQTDGGYRFQIEMVRRWFSS
ncbi:MAG: AAA family ATPase [Anaerolineae bacterium]|nr:AAA family ATPase [Anaerolineae bacterium]